MIIIPLKYIIWLSDYVDLLIKALANAIDR